MSYDGPGNPYRTYIIPTRDDLNRILSFDTIGMVPYHSLPAGSYYILGGSYHFKAEDLKDPVKAPDIGDVETVTNFETPGVQEIAKQAAWTEVMHIRPTKWQGPSPEELARMTKKELATWHNRLNGTDGIPEPTPKYIKRPRKR